MDKLAGLMNIRIPKGYKDELERIAGELYFGNLSHATREIIKIGLERYSEQEEWNRKRGHATPKGLLPPLDYERSEPES